MAQEAAIDGGAKLACVRALLARQLRRARVSPCVNITSILWFASRLRAVTFSLIEVYNRKSS
jgi:hypothetical protein